MNPHTYGIGFQLEIFFHLAFLPASLGVDPDPDNRGLFISQRLHADLQRASACATACSVLNTRRQSESRQADVSAITLDSDMSRSLGLLPSLPATIHHRSYRHGL